MKFLKILLFLFLILLVAAIGGVIFSNRIVSEMTKTAYSEFENLRYSIRGSEIWFDNFSLNGKDLGKGKAKVALKREGFLGLNFKIELSDMVLEDVDLKKIYDTPEKMIDSFIDKAYEPVVTKASEKPAEDYVKETVRKLEKLDMDADNFINSKIKENIITTNRIKMDYNNLSDLKSKAQKITELDKEIKPLVKEINTEKENMEKAIAQVETERSLMLENIAVELSKLEKIISLNDIKNMNAYIFLDKGQDIASIMKRTLKTLNLINEIRGLPLKIKNIDIDGGTVKFSGLNDNFSKISGEISLGGGNRANVKTTGNDYIVEYKENALVLKTLYGERIDTVIEYEKSGILDEKTVKLVSQLVFQGNAMKNENRTVLSEDEKTKLTEKMSNMHQTQYKAIMAEYEEQTKIIEELIAKVYGKKTRLDNIQKGLLSIGTIIQVGDQPLPEGLPSPGGGTTDTKGTSNN